MRPLCVDLDGTLIHTDTLWESILLLIKKNILFLMLLPFWLYYGKAYLKYQIAKRTELDPSVLPYHQEFLSWLRQQQNRELILITASNEKFAIAIAKHLGIFDKVYASNKEYNLKGKNKAILLNQLFGEKQYDYAGNSTSDLIIWRFAHQAILVNAKTTLINRCKRIATIAKVFLPAPLTIKKISSFLRIHQYAKNLLLFVPLILGQFITDLTLIKQTYLGFLCFCFIASSVYLLNDLLDLNADRKHTTKRFRLLAVGEITIPVALLLSVFFLGLGIELATRLPLAFQIIVVAYYTITICYSFYFKQIVLVDVFTLAALYTLRILAGMAIIDVGYSDWLILFSLFFFTSLAFVKRFNELNKYARSNIPQLVGRGYHVAHTQMISFFGIASGYISAFIFALYLHSTKANMLYHHPQLLYLACPIILYWLSRIWLTAAEGQLDDDPVIFALHDKVSYLLLLCMSVLILSAIF